MILEQETSKKYGYYPQKLKKNSKKLIIMRCDYCNNIVEREYRNTVDYNGIQHKTACLNHDCKFKKRSETYIELNKAPKIGDKFNKLTIIENPYWINSYGNRVGKIRCQCNCGNIKEISLSNLIRQRIISCGCARKENARKTHGMSNTKLFSIWAGMIKRCNTDNPKLFKFYKGKGISVCAEWINNFPNFYNWAINNGYKEGLSIDRTNPDKQERGYSPENCKWMTRSENSSKVSKDRELLISNLRKEIELLKIENIQLKSSVR